MTDAQHIYLAVCGLVIVGTIAALIWAALGEDES